MEINKIKKAAEIAKARTSDKRWTAAIDKAVAGVESGWGIITELRHCLVITTECGKTYRANEKHCQCEAFFMNQACKHRAMARLVAIAETIEETAPAVSRDEMIAEIKSTFAAKFPGKSLTDTICAHFGNYSINHLGIN